MIPESDNACPGCNSPVKNEEIRKHIQACQRYPLSILKDVLRMEEDKKIPRNIIKFLKQELEVSLDILRKLHSTPSVPKKSMKEDYSSLFELEEEEEKPQPPKINSSNNINVYGAQIVVCKGGCNNKYYENFDRDMLITLFNCWHTFCLPCVNKYINNQFVEKCGALKCLDSACKIDIDGEQIRAIIGKEKFEILESKALRKMYNLFSCCKCKAEFELSEGNAKDAPKKDANGNALKTQHAKDYAINRFVCPSSSCKTQQCKTCQAMPYHLGMTCKEYKDRALQKKCRYCTQPLTQKNFFKTNQRALADICNSKECQQSAKQACTKINPCGHPCFGYRGEAKCMPCLSQKCAQANKVALKNVNADEYCAVCYVEPLSAAPCVMSECGHIFHVKCLKKRFQIKWLTPRIFFNFCFCPLCKKWISVTPDSQLFKMAEEFRILRQSIQKMAMERLKFEELEKNDEKLKDKSSPYFGKPKQYATAIYAYFQCFKCKNPYFGGRKDCMAAMNEAQGGGSFDPKELICPNCCEIPIDDCPKHGKDFIEFKCKFCCSVAQWFCWGNTHFCEPCHKRQCNGDYVSKYTKDQLPKCLGAGKCPTGGKHGDNGEQKMLGCAICRNFKQNNKSF